MLLYYTWQLDGSVCVCGGGACCGVNCAIASLAQWLHTPEVYLWSSQNRSSVVVEVSAGETAFATIAVNADK